MMSEFDELLDATPPDVEPPEFVMECGFCHVKKLFTKKETKKSLEDLAGCMIKSAKEVYMFMRQWCG